MMICPQCRTQMQSDHVRFCPKCGTGLTGAGAALPQPQPQGIPRQNAVSAAPDPAQNQKKRSAKPLLITLGVIVCLIAAAAGIWVLTNRKKPSAAPESQAAESQAADHDAAYEAASAYLRQNILESETFRSSTPEKRRELAEAMIAELNRQGLIDADSVKYDEESNCCLFRHLDGSECILELNDPEEDVFASASGEASSPFYREDGTAPGEDDRIFRHPTFPSNMTPYREPDRTALIIDDSCTAFASANYQEDVTEWSENHLRTACDDDITVAEMRTVLRDYDFIDLECHGGYADGVPRIVIHDTVTLTDDIRQDMQASRISERYTTKYRAYALNPAFFQHYYDNGQLDGKIVWISACNGYRNDRLASAFAACGADAVLASTRTIYIYYSIRMRNIFVYHLMLGKTVQEALDAAKDEYGGDDTVYLPKNGEDPAEIMVHCGGDKRLFTLTSDAADYVSSGTVTGDVKDEQGRPVANAQVYIYSDPLEGNEVGFSCQTNQRGEYTATVVTGEYYLRVEPAKADLEVYTADEKFSVRTDTDTVLETVVLRRARDAAPEPQSTVTFNGHTYSLINRSMTWTQAKQYCEQLGGYLAVIGDEEEQNAVTGLLTQNTATNRNCYWVGLQRTGEEWTWLDGSAAEYKNWAENEPNNKQGAGGEAFVHVYGQVRDGGTGHKSIGTWNDAADNGADYSDAFYEMQHFGLICEWDTETPDLSPETLSNPYANLKGAVYQGSYVATQGLTALRFVIEESPADGEWHATFHFSAHPDNPGVPTGSYTMIGTVQERFADGAVRVRFTGKEWKQHPATYVFVDFTALISGDRKTLTSSDYQVDLKLVG